MEHFIETVRKYPCLWNTTAIEYRDQELKDAAWAEVMKETDLSSVKEVKLKWKKLRDSYRDALKRQSDMLAKEPAGGARKSYPWKYAGLMRFLQPYMGRRRPAAPPPSNGHLTNDRSSEESDEEDEEAVSAPAAAGAHSAAGAGPADASPKRKGDTLAAIDRKLDFLCRAASKRACASGDPPAPRDAPAPRRDPPAPDPLDIFFNSMCQSTKRFPFPTQIRIKRRLFEAVIEAEEALVAEQQSYASLWARAGGGGGVGAAAGGGSSSSEDAECEEPS